MPFQILIKNDKGTYVSYNVADQESCSANSYEFIRPLPENKGKGYFSTISIRQDLEIGITRCRFDKDYSARVSLPQPMMIFGFCLSGHTLSRNSCHSEPVAMTPGTSYTHFFLDPVFERKTAENQDLLTLVVRVSPNFLTNLFAPDREWDTETQNTLEKAFSEGHFFASHLMTPQMKTVLYQIFNNPHQGRIARIFLESKALELIALKLEQTIGPACPQQQETFISPEDWDRVCRAKDLLISKLQFPPSLGDLARQVNMSHVRLNRGFKKIFGCTVFEYLRKERLAHARMLIEEDPTDLTRIAFESGFCSSSHFAASFLKEYGIRPSEYRLSLGTLKRRRVSSFSLC